MTSVNGNSVETLPEILDGTDLDRLEAAEGKLGLMTQLFVKSDQCGVECESNKQFARTLRDTIEGLKREFLEGEIRRRQGNQ